VQAQELAAEIVDGHRVRVVVHEQRGEERRQIDHARERLGARAARHRLGREIELERELVPELDQEELVPGRAEAWLCIAHRCVDPGPVVAAREPAAARALGAGEYVARPRSAQCRTALSIWDTHEMSPPNPARSIW
jgi:hypothetical protein